jgi:hypothetical protein
MYKEQSAEEVGSTAEKTHPANISKISAAMNSPIQLTVGQGPQTILSGEPITSSSQIPVRSRIIPTPRSREMVKRVLSIIAVVVVMGLRLLK